MSVFQAIRQDDAIRNTPDPDVARAVWDNTGRLLYMNSAFCTLCGRNAADPLIITDILHFDDPAEVFGRPNFSDAPLISQLGSGYHSVYLEATGINIHLQFDWIDLPGGRRVLVASTDEVAAPPEEIIAGWIAQPLPKPSSSPSMAPDIFQSLSRDAMIIFDDLGIIMESNGAFLQLTGHEAVEGVSLLDFVVDDDKAGIRAVLSDLTRGRVKERRTIQFDTRLRAINGAVIAVEWSCRAVDDVYYALGRDVSAQRRAEYSLARLSDQLREAEEIGYIGHWYWKLGQDNIEFSDELYRIFGVDSARFQPTLDLVNDFVHRRDVGRMMRAFQRAIIEQNDHDIDFRIKRPDGIYAHVRCRGRCKLDNEGDVIALFGIMQDISDRIAQENDLRQAKDEAEHAYATKSQFLANMSHELRTPLNAIIGFSEILERQLFGPLGNEKYVNYTKGIRESGEHLLDLITDILDMSKIEAGQYKLAVEKLSMEKVLHTAIHMIEGRAIERGVKISLSMDKNPRDIIADKRAMMQVILNILSNAVKFSHPNGKVQIQYLERSDYVSLRITDQGIGIPANKMPYIAKPFEQVSNHYNRSHEGSGLGLAISKELVELHGGALHIDSVLDRGTSVTIRLPYSSDMRA